jgi:hypothetical protein
MTDLYRAVIINYFVLNKVYICVYVFQIVNKAVSTHYGTLSRLQLLPNNSVSNDPVWETYLGMYKSFMSLFYYFN